MENSICCFTLCILQGASEDITPKKEKPEKGNENYQKVKEVGTLALYPPLLLLCECALPRKDLSIIPCGQGCCVFVTRGLDVVLLSSSLHLWGLSVLRMIASNDCFPSNNQPGIQKINSKKCKIKEQILNKSRNAV